VFGKYLLGLTTLAFMRVPYWKTIKDSLQRLYTPELDWIQIEVSSHCDASCIYCPHAVFRNIWLNRHLPLRTFRRLLPALSEVKLVYLQGWGEPFQNPDFFEMVKLAKDAGCMVGTSTNGMLLNGKTIGQIIESGMDIIAFSLAGIDPNNGMIRKGTKFETIMEAVKSINREKAKAKTTLPSINIAYMLLRSRIDDLTGLPVAFSGWGINQIVISTLDFIPDRKFVTEAIFPDNNEEYERLRAQLDKVVARGRSDGLDIHYNLYNPSRRRKVCTENVQYSLFVSSDGTVSPCVFTNMPIKEPSLQDDAMFPPYRRLTFGNINENTLSRIWNQKDYKNFRESFNTDRLPETCVKCPKLYIT